MRLILSRIHHAFGMIRLLALAWKDWPPGPLKDVVMAYCESAYAFALFSPKTSSAASRASFLPQFSRLVARSSSKRLFTFLIHSLRSFAGPVIPL
jgi:hypothetical protein